ncbi:unnamed protein product [Closterium sp. NIES-54]
MEVARTSMIHAVAPHFLWPLAVWYAAHQLNLWPRVSLPETLPTLRWTGEVGDASVFRVWGSRAFVRDTSADKLSAHAIPCGPAPSGVSQVDPLTGTVPVEVAVDLGAARGAGSGGAEPGDAEPGGVEPGVLSLGGVEPGGAESGVAEPRGTASSGAGDSAAGDTGAGGAGVTAGAGGTGGAAAPSPEGALTRGIGAARTGSVGGFGPGDPTEPRARGPGTGGTGTGGAGAIGARAGGTGAGDPGAGGAGAGGVVAGGTGAGDIVRPRPYFVPLLEQVLFVPSSTGLSPPLLCPPPEQSQPPLQPTSPLPAASPYAAETGGLPEHRETASRPALHVRTGHRVPRPRPPPVPGTHAMAHRPSSVPLRVPLPPPLESSLPAVPDLQSDRARAASPTVTRLLAIAVTDPSFESTATSALVNELVDFAAACRLDYATTLVAESGSASPLSVGEECTLGTNIHEDGQEDFECLAASVPRFVPMLLAPEGDPDAPDIPTPRSYAEAITSPYSSQWHAAMDAEMASWKSTGTYVDAVPPSRANIVNGMWIFRVKRPSGSAPAFKARYVARGFSQQQGVDYFQTFFPTPKMTTLTVLLHVAAQRDYELLFLDFSTAFLQGSLHEEIWLRRPPGFTGSFRSGVMAAQELRWLTYMLTDLGEQPRSPLVLYADNKAMIALCQEHRLEHQTKHIALRYFLTRELQQRGQLCLAYVATRANTADVFTKAFPPGQHSRRRDSQHHGATAATASRPNLILLAELLKSFKDDILKAVSDTTQQTFDAAGFKILPDVIGSLAQGCCGSSPSANDAENAPRREASRQRGKRPGGVVEAGGEESISAKRSKGPGGSQATKPGPHSKGDGGESAKGVLADHGAAHAAGASASPVILVKPPRPTSDGADRQGVADKEMPAAQTATDGGGRTQPTVVAATVEGAHRTVTPHVAAPTSSVPPTAPPIAARPPANPTSALLLPQLGARSAAAPTPSQPEAGTIATPTSGNVSVPAHNAAVVDAAAEKGVSAALATGGKPLDKDFHDADIAAIRTHLDAATCTGQPPALAISDTAHVEPSASPAGGSAEPKSATDAAGKGSLKGKMKADTRKGKASSQRKTLTISATKDKAVENQDEKSIGEGKLAKNGKEKAVENQAEKSVGEGKPEKKGKDKAAEKEKEKEKGRKGHGIRHDSLGDGKGWVGEIKVPSNSRDKMELACLHSIAYILYDGYVSKVLMDELTDLEETKMEK